MKIPFCSVKLHCNLLYSTGPSWEAYTIAYLSSQKNIISHVTPIPGNGNYPFFINEKSFFQPPPDFPALIESLDGDVMKLTADQVLEN